MAYVGLGLLLLGALALIIGLIAPKVIWRWKEPRRSKAAMLSIATAGLGFLIIALSVHTTNNSFSDLESNTLIPHASPVYEALANLSKGQPVLFDATLLRLDDLTEKGRVTEPDMLARVTRIEAAP